MVEHIRVAARDFLSALDAALKAEERETWTGVHKRPFRERLAAWAVCHEKRVALEALLVDRQYAADPEPLVGWDDGVTIGGERVEVPIRFDSGPAVAAVKSMRDAVQAAVDDICLSPPCGGLTGAAAAAMAQAGKPTGFERVGHEDDGEVEP